MANQTMETGKIKNVCLLGHGGNGKTSLTEAMLYLAGETDRLGKTADGNTVSDYDPEEIKRKFSIAASVSASASPFTTSPFAFWKFSIAVFVNSPKKPVHSPAK